MVLARLDAPAVRLPQKLEVVFLSALILSSLTTADAVFLTDPHMDPSPAAIESTLKSP